VLKVCKFQILPIHPPSRRLSESDPAVIVSCDEATLCCCRHFCFLYGLVYLQLESKVSTLNLHTWTTFNSTHLNLNFASCVYLIPPPPQGERLSDRAPPLHHWPLDIAPSLRLSSPPHAAPRRVTSCHRANTLDCYSSFASMPSRTARGCRPQSHSSITLICI
jgi:hypothetical protein